MSKRQRMSSQQVIKSLFETDDGISSENELSWYESEPEIDVLSDSNRETDGSDTKSEDSDGSVSQEVQGKIDICRERNQRMKEHQGEISSQAQAQNAKDLRQTRL